MKGGIVLQIQVGKYKDKKAIAHHAKQEQQFIDRKKVLVNVYDDDDFKTMLAEGVLIDMWKCTQIGFSS